MIAKKELIDDSLMETKNFVYEFLFFQHKIHEKLDLLPVYFVTSSVVSLSERQNRHVAKSNEKLALHAALQYSVTNFEKLPFCPIIAKISLYMNLIIYSCGYVIKTVF